MSDNEHALRQLAMDYMDGKVYFIEDWDTAEEALRCFIVLGLSDPNVLKKAIERGVASYYEYIDHAGPMAINGWPVFYSCRPFYKADVEEFKQYCKEIGDFKKGFLEKK